MKTITVFFIMLAVCFSVVSGVQGAERARCNVTVVGQGNPAIDVPAVLAAVNGPSSSGILTVCLKGAFDFGTGGGPDTFVSINPPNATYELNIRGLDDHAGNKAAIRNGFHPLSFNPASTLLSLSIRNLSFEKPLMTAISIMRGNVLVEISDNEIHGVVTAAVVIGGQPITFREGIAITSTFSDIAGKVVIKNNKVDGGVYGPGDATISVNVGILVNGKLSGGNEYNITGEVLVEDNLVKNWSGNGIYSLGSAGVTIKKNRVKPGPIANGAGRYVANGIVIISNNDALVEKNTINMTPALKLDGSPADSLGIGLGPANNNVFRNNKVRGTGLYAVGVFGISQNNLFEKNHIANFSFSPAGATVYLGNGATNNTFIGCSGTVMGNISGNTIQSSHQCRDDDDDDD